MFSTPSPLLQKYLISDLPTAAEIKPYLERMDAARWYTNFGPLSHEFEQKITGLLAAADPRGNDGAIFVTTIATCYHALEIGLRMLNLPPGGKVLLPAISFPACPLAIQHAGLEPVFADVDAENWMLTPAIARRAAQKIELAAVMPLALYGIPFPVDEWNKFYRDTGIAIAIDAAAAVESQAIPQKGFVAHSLHATKPFGVGEGGLLVSRDPDLINRVRVYSNFGTIDRVAYNDGTNAKMSEYHAAVGLAQFGRWAKIKQTRRAVLDMYRTQLKPISNRFSFHPALDSAVVSQLILRFHEPVASDFIARGQEMGFALHRTYLPPLYQHPHFADVSLASVDGAILAGSETPDKKAGHMQHSEMLFRHLVGVPFHPLLGEHEIGEVVGLLSGFLESSRQKRRQA